VYTSRLEVFRRHGVVFRQCQWVAEQDHGDHSPHHSEYDIQVPEDYGFPPERVDTFLNATDLALGHPADGYRLVQHRYWYRLDDINYN